MMGMFNSGTSAIAVIEEMTAGVNVRKKRRFIDWFILVLVKYIVRKVMNNFHKSPFYNVS